MATNRYAGNILQHERGFRGGTYGATGPVASTPKSRERHTRAICGNGGATLGIGPVLEVYLVITEISLRQLVSNDRREALDEQ